MSRTSAALRSATQHAMPPEFSKKWGTECLNTRFPLPTLQCTGYSVKRILILLFLYSSTKAKTKRMSSGTLFKTQYLEKYGGKRGTECLTTSLLLPILLYAGYSVKLIIIKIGHGHHHRTFRSSFIITHTNAKLSLSLTNCSQLAFPTFH